MASLSFERPDKGRFPAIELGYRAAREGGTLGAVLNAANEVAVGEFLAGRCSFAGISRTVGEVMAEHAAPANASLQDIWEADRWAREAALLSCRRRREAEA
jgi:1-deoxy-D-xylulose-5-phosphate reductoisomerase